MPRAVKAEDGEPAPRKVRELGQELAAIEIALSMVAVISMRGRRKRIGILVAHLQALADHAVYQRDGVDPATLDRLAGRIESGHDAMDR